MTKLPSAQSADNADSPKGPDARFILANERTLLAWMRTALTIVAGGIALIGFTSGHSLQTSGGIAAILFGALVAYIGYARYQSADHAMRQGQLPDRGYGPIIQAAGVIIFALVVAAVEATRLITK